MLATRAGSEVGTRFPVRPATHLIVTSACPQRAASSGSGRRVGDEHVDLVERADAEGGAALELGGVGDDDDLARAADHGAGHLRLVEIGVHDPGRRIDGRDGQDGVVGLEGLDLLDRQRADGLGVVGAVACRPADRQRSRGRRAPKTWAMRSELVMTVMPPVGASSSAQASVVDPVSMNSVSPRSTIIGQLAGDRRPWRRHSPPCAAGSLTSRLQARPLAPPCTFWTTPCLGQHAEVAPDRLGRDVEALGQRLDRDLPVPADDRRNLALPLLWFHSAPKRRHETSQSDQVNSFLQSTVEFLIVLPQLLTNWSFHGHLCPIRFKGGPARTGELLTDVARRPSFRVFDVAVIGAGVSAAPSRGASRWKVRASSCSRRRSTFSTAPRRATAPSCIPASTRRRARSNSPASRPAMPSISRSTSASNLPLLRSGAMVLAWTEEQEAALPASDGAGADQWHRRRPAADGAEARDARARHRRHAAGGFRVPREYLIDPWSAPHAYLLQAIENGAVLLRDCEVTGGIYDGVAWRLETSRGGVEARLVVNAAGLYGDIVDERLTGRRDFHIKPRKGQFVVYDKPAARSPRTSLLPVPSKTTKGIVVCRTIYGNLLVGPTAEEQEDARHRRTVAEDARRAAPARRGDPAGACRRGRDGDLCRPAPGDRIQGLPDPRPRGPGLHHRRRHPLDRAELGARRGALRPGAGGAARHPGDSRCRPRLAAPAQP